MFSNDLIDIDYGTVSDDRDTRVTVFCDGVRVHQLVITPAMPQNMFDVYVERESQTQTQTPNIITQCFDVEIAAVVRHHLPELPEYQVQAVVDSLPRLEANKNTPRVDVSRNWCEICDALQGYESRPVSILFWNNHEARYNPNRKASERWEIAQYDAHGIPTIVAVYPELMDVATHCKEWRF